MQAQTYSSSIMCCGLLASVAYRNAWWPARPGCTPTCLCSVHLNAASVFTQSTHKYFSSFTLYTVCFRAERDSDCPVSHTGRHLPCGKKNPNGFLVSVILELGTIFQNLQLRNMSYQGGFLRIATRMINYFLLFNL